MLNETSEGMFTIEFELSLILLLVFRGLWLGRSIAALPLPLRCLLKLEFVFIPKEVRLTDFAKF